MWGIVASAVSGFAVIWWLLEFLKRRSLAVFAVYRLLLAGLVFFLIATGARSPTV